MRYIVYGAGGVGSVIGASLFSHGYQVVLIGNPEHMQSIREDGLRIITPDTTTNVMVEANNTAEEIAPFGDGDVVFLTVKSQHTIRCLGQLKNAGASRMLPIFCFQNSIWNEPMASRVFDNVYGVAVSLFVTFLKSGEVMTPLRGVTGHLEVGRYPSGSDEVAEEVVRVLGESDFDACLNETVMKAKAAKCLINLINAFDAITDTKAPEEFTRHVRKEAEQIWNAAGIEWETMEEYDRRSRARLPMDTSRTQKKSSTWQSLAKGTGNVEAGQINGDLVTLGKFVGKEAPYNECLWRVCTHMALMKEKPGKHTKSDLERMIAGRSWPNSTSINL